MFLKTHPKPAVNIITALTEIVGPLTQSQRIDIEILIRDAIDQSYHDAAYVEEKEMAAIEDERHNNMTDARTTMSDAMFNIRLNTTICNACQTKAMEHINDRCHELTGEIAAHINPEIKP